MAAPDSKSKVDFTLVGGSLDSSVPRIELPTLTSIRRRRTRPTVILKARGPATPRLDEIVGYWLWRA